ncbi:hypothetical protein F5Y08DRAFT_329233 [Xylaria arbuscula]|nr:hypothetical protein F5Y08DRAFT_329233 [Xylaria arbuscula]
MASTFRPVNSPLAIKVDKPDENIPSPTTPTPTKATFGQRPLPTSPFPQTVQIPESINEVEPPHRDNMQATQVPRRDSEDVDMNDTDGEAHGHEDSNGSNDEGANADDAKSNKKKKSQRFYCTEYPPCKLSFTRSEHLARHVRKHTGERPFKCHCQRRFSRLDNLRQHAQTVHVNEDIPLDSLAATGTRFQRQIRTDRVRQPGRARASTAGSIGAPPRGHSKSLSTSSISSVGSNFSTRDELRRRPPALAVADYRFPFSSEAYPHRPPSPGDFSTPTSATFSNGQNSPRWGPAMVSPASSHSRSHSLYLDSQVPPARRLSIPSSMVPLQSPGLSRLPFGPRSDAPNGSQPAPYSPSVSVLASPTSSVVPFGRRDSASITEDVRRRTWHPESNNFNPTSGSRLSQVFGENQYPIPTQSHGHLPVPQQQPSSPVRLPSIASFDILPHRPASPLRSNASAMMAKPDVLQPSRLLTANTPQSEEREKWNPSGWAMDLHKNLTRLDLASNATPSDSANTWAREATQAMDAQADRIRMNPHTVRFHESVMAHDPPTTSNPRVSHQYTMSAPSMASSRESKRRAWHQSGGSHLGEMPPEKITRVDRMVHPNIREFSGFPARHNAVRPVPHEESSGERGMGALETLVAVATGEGNATKAY